MKKICLFILSLCCMSIYAKKIYPAKIILQNNSVIECFTTIPNNKKLKKPIVYKNNLDSEDTFELEIDQVKTIIIITDNGKQYTFEKEKLYTIANKKGEVYFKESKKSTWQALVFYDDEIQVYYTSEYYMIEEETNTLIPLNSARYINVNHVSADVSSNVKISYKRIQENAPTYIFDRLPIGEGWVSRIYSKEFIKNVSKYFRDEPAFVEIIKEKDFKYRDYIELALAYIEYKYEQK